MRVAEIRYPARDFCVVALQSDKREFDRYIAKTMPDTCKELGIDATLSPRAARAKVVALKGESALWFNAVNACLDENWNRMLRQAMRQESWQPLRMPEFELQEVNAEGFRVCMLCELIPAAQLGRYKGLVIAPKPKTVEQSEVEAAIQNLWRSSYTLKDTGAAAATGDEIIVDYVGKKTGRAAPVRAEGVQFTLGSREPVSGLGKAVRGHLAGENVSCAIAPPRGSKAAAEELTVTIRRVCAKTYPPLDDAFARQFTRAASLEQLREAVRSEHERRALVSAIHYEKNHLDATVGRNLTVEISEYLLSRRVNKRLHGRSAAALPLGAEEESESQKEILADLARQEEEDRLRARVAMLLVAKAEGIRPTKEEIDKEYSRMARTSHTPEDVVRRDKPEFFVSQNLTVAKAKSFVQKNNRILQGYESK